MKLWILRHGEAEPRKTTDPERALTKHGHKEAQAAGHCLAKHAGAGLVVLASPYRRAQQTAEAVLQELRRSATDLQTVPWCTPDEDPVAALDHLAFREETELLVVSHMPFVSALAGLLVEGDWRAGPPMHTASLIELDVPIVAARMAQLLSLRHPPEFKKAHI
ncbi:MAG: phosphohistidine phosphatase SixA [Spongiibacteraceae bacterium]